MIFEWIGTNLHRYALQILTMAIHRNRFCIIDIVKICRYNASSKKAKRIKMRANIVLENVDNAVLNAIKSVIKLNPQVKFKINKTKAEQSEPNKETLRAMRDIKNGVNLQSYTLDELVEIAKASRVKA